jgi:hypothetical protein
LRARHTAAALLNDVAGLTETVEHRETCVLKGKETLLPFGYAVYQNYNIDILYN